MWIGSRCENRSRWAADEGRSAGGADRSAALTGKARLKSLRPRLLTAVWECLRGESRLRAIKNFNIHDGVASPSAEDMSPKNKVGLPHPGIPSSLPASVPVNWRALWKRYDGKEPKEIDPALGNNHSAYLAGSFPIQHLTGKPKFDVGLGPRI